MAINNPINTITVHLVLTKPQYVKRDSKETFTIANCALNVRKQNKSGGSRLCAAWLTVMAYGKLAEELASLSVGEQFIVSGSLEGDKDKKPVINARSLIVLGKTVKGAESSQKAMWKAYPDEHGEDEHGKDEEEDEEEEIDEMLQDIDPEYRDQFLYPTPKAEPLAICSQDEEWDESVYD